MTIPSEQPHESQSHEHILKRVSDYYTEKVTTHGPVHRGVDWNSTESQEMRFRQMLKVVDTDSDAPFSLIDYGCGYGAMAGFMKSQRERGKLPPFEYIGFDISQAMIDQANAANPDPGACRFTADLNGLPPADYTVASGIFSVKLATPAEEWKQYCLDTMDTLARLSTKGFAFNMLTGFADPDRMRPDLYYPDPHWIFDHCRTKYSKWVALLHDYGIYEFTIHVKLLG